MLPSRKLSLVSLSFSLGVITRTGRGYLYATIVLTSQNRSRNSLSLLHLEKIISRRFPSTTILHVAFGQNA